MRHDFAKRVRSKRGAALGYALVIMLVCFALCMALLSVTLLAIRQTQLQGALLTNQAETDLWGQRFSDWLTGENGLLVLDLSKTPQGEESRAAVETRLQGYVDLTAENDWIHVTVDAGSDLFFVTYGCGSLNLTYTCAFSRSENRWTNTLTGWTVGAGMASPSEGES